MRVPDWTKCEKSDDCIVIGGIMREEGWGRFMINITFATNFVHRVRSQTNYNVNIMNEQGVIIASCDEERVGDFHSSAFKMIKENISISKTENLSPNQIGVKSPGVNLLIRENFIPIGVIGVSGPPAEVEPIAKLIKMTFETLYDYEIQKNSVLTSGTAFGRMLLVDKPRNLTQIRLQAKSLGIREEVNRYPILINYSGMENKATIHEKFMVDYHKISAYSSEDLLFLMGDVLVLFKKSENKNTVAGYRNEVLKFIGEMDQWFYHCDERHKTNYICGIVQNSFVYYQRIYETMLWLQSYRRKSDCKVHFLGDFLTEYMMGNLSLEILEPFLDVYVRIIDTQMDRNVFLETVKALIASNMNLNAASKLLYLHKNTVTNRVKKMRETLGIDPLRNTKDAIFLIILYDYIESNYS